MGQADGRLHASALPITSVSFGVLFDFSGTFSWSQEKELH